MAAEPIPAEAIDFTHPNLAIRDGAQYGDMGYPRMVVRPDGKLVTIYYFNSAEHPQHPIAATIWNPSEDRTDDAMSTGSTTWLTAHILACICSICSFLSKEE